jgi:hypothetical protein
MLLLPELLLVLPAWALTLPPLFMVEPVLNPLFPPSSPDEQANKAATATHARLTLNAFISKLPRQDAMKWTLRNQIF